MSLPRVLLVEDDPSIRRFVELAWEDQAIELRQAATVAESLDQLRHGSPYRLVITDLMLPDGSGLQVLRALAADPGLRAHARLAVFSAGLSAERRAELEGLGVDAVIAKPASLGQLTACLERALMVDAPAPAAAAGAPDDAFALAVEHYFAGDQGLYDSYRTRCLRQFRDDRGTGDAALAAADLQALRRLAHSLKTVLLILGHENDSVLARQVEGDAAEGRLASAGAGWNRLADRLSWLAASAA
jgi:DNA-binding response OmpR family regulator